MYNSISLDKWKEADVEKAYTYSEPVINAIRSKKYTLMAANDSVFS